MLKKLPFIAAAVGAALMAAAPAQAFSVQYVAGNNGVDNLQGTAIFQNFDALTPGAPFGGGLAIFSNSVSGAAARPAFWSTGNFLAVQADNTSSITIGLPQIQVLSFVLGSLDSYNRVVLDMLNGPDIVLDGNQITQGVQADGDQADPDVNGRVFYHTQGLDSIIGATFTSFGANAFEIDNISIAAPEAATWGMMILAAGMAGASLRRRRGRPAAV